MNSKKSDYGSLEYWDGENEFSLHDSDYGSLEYWDGENEFSLHDAVCLWLDYKPEDGGVDRKFPSDLRMAYEYFLNLSKKGELTVWPCHEYERENLRKLYKKGRYPFNPDEPADLSDGAIEKAFKKRGILSSMRYWFDTLPIFNDPEDDKVDPELAEAERYYHGIAVWRKDLMRLSKKINHKPLFLYPELRAGKSLKEIWPTNPTIHLPLENREKPQLPSPKKLLKRKPTSKKKKKRLKPKITSKLKPPARPRKAKIIAKHKPKAGSRKTKDTLKTDKVKIKTVRQTVERTANTVVTHSSDFRSMDVHGVRYSFTTQQARVVEYLFEQPTHEASDQAISENCEVGKRIRDSFKNHPAWGKLIIQGGTKGTRRLDLDFKD